MGDVVSFPRCAPRSGLLPRPVAQAPAHRPPDGWPDDTRVVDKLTGRTGAVTGRGWSCSFIGVRTYSVRWDDRPALPADIVFASRLMLLRPTPCGAVVRLPDGRTLRRLPPGAAGDQAATWVPAPEFDPPPPSAA